MQTNFVAYVSQAKILAEQELLTWHIDLDDSGIALPGTGWNLRRIAKDGNPVSSKLRLFSTVESVVDEMRQKGIPFVAFHDRKVVPISIEWQDLIKAYVLNQILVLGRSLTHVTATCAAIRLMATSTNNKAPWLLSPDDINLCLSIAAAVQPSGQSVVVIRAFVKTVLDTYHLTETSPLLPSIESRYLKGPEKFSEARYVREKSSLKETLSSRKAEEKLPEMRAFWELTRIVFTERPQTFFDVIRFAQARLLILTGLRIGEIALIPLDWKRSRQHYDHHGKSAGELGGISSSLQLRYFAEKQGSSRKQGGTLWETTQYVPTMFEKIIEDTLDEIERLTRPLRRTLKAQCETGRLLPMYGEKDLISVADLYVHLTGMVLTTEIDASTLEQYLGRYRESNDLVHLDELMRVQTLDHYKTRMAFYQFANRLEKTGFTLRDRNGNLAGPRAPVSTYAQVGDVEEYIREKTPTKVSDLTPFHLDSGRQIQPWEFLFLLPKRALGEGRDGIPCHVGKVVGVGLATEEILGLGLSAASGKNTTLFGAYSETEEDRLLTLLPHSLRHLQNTELFRLGVADTIITKRFNRRSVAQSYEYDHRSLQEELDQVSLPNEWEIYLGPKASSVAKMISAGRANGPIVKEFKRVQRDQGDEAAYSYLKAEADGFHATPYGHCLNSFTVDPCPTHLECFNGCVHLSATDLPENRKHLITLQGKLKDALQAARAKSSTTIGRDNQIRHAEVRLVNVSKLLDTPPGELAFPDGQDLSRKNKRRSVIDG